MANPPRQFLLRDNTVDLLQAFLTRVKDNDSKIDLDASWQAWLPDLNGEEDGFSLTEGRLLHELTALERALGVLHDGVAEGRRILDQRRLKARQREFNINAIPNEVLSGIFEASYDCDIWDNETSRRVSHVSRRFRAVALDTPFIWTVLHNAQSADELNVFLDRSKKAKLTVCLNEHFGSPKYLRPKITTEEFIRAVSEAELRRRWYEFRCTVYNEEDVKTIGKLMGGERCTLPFLTSMTIMSQIPHNDPIRADFCQLWRTPSLRHFSGINAYLPNQTIGETLKSAVLDFERLSPSSDLQSALNAIAQVRTLTLRAHRSDNMEAPPSKRVELVKLKSLIVLLSSRSLYRLFGARHTFEWFTTRKITKLTLKVDAMDPAGNSLDFSSSGDNPYPVLQELEVIWNKFTVFEEHVFPNVLAKLPGLQGVKFPPLHTLRLHHCGGINDAAIREIVEVLCRSPQWPDFRRLELHHCSGLTVQNLERLKENLGDKLFYVPSNYFIGY